MNVIQTQKLRMYVALLAFLKSNKDVLAKLPNADTFVAQLESEVAAIQADDLLQKQDMKELTRQKNVVQQQLVDATLEVSEKFQPYAVFIKNDLLLNAVRFTGSELKHLVDIELLQRAKGLYQRVNENLAGLAPYGLTADTQKVYNDRILLLENTLPILHQERMDKKEITARLVKEFAAADSAIENIDMLVRMVSKTEVKFYTDYQDTRKVDYSYATVEFVGYVVDAETGEGIPNAVVTITPKESSEAPIEKNTAAKGGFQIKTIGAGFYNVTVTKLSYATKTLDIVITGDKPYNLNMKMEKS